MTLDDQQEMKSARHPRAYESIKENIDPAIYNAYMDGIELRKENEIPARGH